MGLVASPQVFEQRAANAKNVLVKGEAIVINHRLRPPPGQSNNGRPVNRPVTMACSRTILVSTTTVAVGSTVSLLLLIWLRSLRRTHN